jgi:hypothetical protein
MDNKTTKALLAKLRQPIHIDYISTYILNETKENTLKIINELIEGGVVEESKDEKNYYMVRNKRN